MSKILIFGAGWLGYKFRDYLNAKISLVDITNKKSVENELDLHKPVIVINTAGKTGRPNIDWCEEHKIETVNSNITGALVLLKACLDRGIYLVHLSSGCIFTGESPSKNGFTEDDAPNPVSFYSWSKAKADEILEKFPTLILRIRMPIDKEPNPRNLITKLASYPMVIDVENSITIVDDLLLTTKEIINRRKTGIYNVVNPVPIKHREIMEMYKQIVNLNHGYTLISPEQLITKGLAKARRSNCILSIKKLEKEGINLQTSYEGIKKCMIAYKEQLKKM